MTLLSGMESESKTYKVSVILSLFSSKRFFKKAIDSVLNQTFSNSELIIEDGGSMDNKINNATNDE